MTPAPYPGQAIERRRWITARRGARNRLDPYKPHAVTIEQEYSEAGHLVSVLAIFLTNRECPWRCLMCDLWQDTLPQTAPRGAIPAQIDHALQEFERNRPVAFPGANDTKPHVKLYNSGSFFDQRAIPPSDYSAIASRVHQFKRAIVECHPRLVGEEVLRFRDLLQPDLEVAMGLETVHPEVLARLNKGMTLEHFANASSFLRRHGIGVRAFVILRPPFMTEQEGIIWAKRSVDFAFECGANVVSVIPTRAGNGALDHLATRGEFAPPRLSSLEETLDYGIHLRRGRVFADVWDLQRFSDCPSCFQARRARLEALNHSQSLLPRIACPHCGS